MGERRRPTLGARGALPDLVRGIVYGTGADKGVAASRKRWRPAGVLRPRRCRCGMELPLTGKCDDCD